MRIFWILLLTSLALSAEEESIEAGLEKSFPKLKIRFHCGVSDKEIKQAEKFFTENCDDHFTSLPRIIDNCKSGSYKEYSFTSHVCELKWDKPCALKKQVPFTAAEICIRPPYNPFSFIFKNSPKQESVKEELKRALESVGCTGIEFQSTMKSQTDYGLKSNNCYVFDPIGCNKNSVKVELKLSQNIRSQFDPTPLPDKVFFLCRFKGTAGQTTAAEAGKK